MKKLLLLIFISLPLSAQNFQGFWKNTLPLSYNDKGQLDKVTTSILVSSNLSAWADYAYTKYLIKFNKTQFKEANPALRPLLDHEPAGFIYTAGNIMIGNFCANILERKGHTKLARVVGSVSLGVHGYATYHNIRVFQNYQRGIKR